MGIGASFHIQKPSRNPANNRRSQADHAHSLCFRRGIIHCYINPIQAHGKNENGNGWNRYITSDKPVDEHDCKGYRENPSTPLRGTAVTVAGEQQPGNEFDGKKPTNSYFHGANQKINHEKFSLCCCLGMILNPLDVALQEADTSSAAANSAAGFDSPDSQADEPPLRGFLSSAAWPLFWAAVRGAVRLAGSCDRSVNPHGLPSRLTAGWRKHNRNHRSQQ